MNTIAAFDNASYAVTASADPVQRLITLTIGCLSTKSTWLYDHGATSNFATAPKVGGVKGEVTTRPLGSTGTVMLSLKDTAGSWAIVNIKDLNALIAAAIKAGASKPVTVFDVYYRDTQKYSRVRPCSGIIARNTAGWPKGFVVEPKYKDALVVLLDKNGKQAGCIRNAGTLATMAVTPLSRS